MAADTQLAKAERIQEIRQTLLNSAIDRGMRVTGDERVRAEDAAILLGVSVGTLKRWRRLSIGPRATHTKPTTYELRELAIYLEQLWRESAHIGAHRPESASP